jgi:hypothetical protein
MQVLAMDGRSRSSGGPIVPTGSRLTREGSGRLVHASSPLRNPLSASDPSAEEASRCSSEQEMLSADLASLSILSSPQGGRWPVLSPALAPVPAAPLTSTAAVAGMGASGPAPLLASSPSGFPLAPPRSGSPRLRRRPLPPSLSLSPPRFPPMSAPASYSATFQLSPFSPPSQQQQPPQPQPQPQPQQQPQPQPDTAVRERMSVSNLVL